MRADMVGAFYVRFWGLFDALPLPELGGLGVKGKEANASSSTEASARSETEGGVKGLEAAKWDALLAPLSGRTVESVKALVTRTIPTPSHSTKPAGGKKAVDRRLLHVRQAGNVKGKERMVVLSAPAGTRTRPGEPSSPASVLSPSIASSVTETDTQGGEEGEDVGGDNETAVGSRESSASTVVEVEGVLSVVVSSSSSALSPAHALPPTSLVSVSPPESTIPRAFPQSSESSATHTQTDISNTPLMDHILALCEAERVVEEERGREEERAWRESCEALLLAKATRQISLERKGWWRFGSSSRSTSRETPRRTAAVVLPTPVTVTPTLALAPTPTAPVPMPIKIAYGYRASSVHVKLLFGAGSSPSLSSYSQSPYTPAASPYSSPSSASSSTSSSVFNESSSSYSGKKNGDDSRSAKFNLETSLTRKLGRFEWLFASARMHGEASAGVGRLSSHPRPYSSSSFTSSSSSSSSSASGAEGRLGEGEQGEGEEDGEEWEEEDEDEEELDTEMETYRVFSSPSPSSSDSPSSSSSSASSSRSRRARSPRRRSPSSPTDSVVIIPSQQDAPAREFSSAARKTKKVLAMKGRSASPLPRPSAWLGRGEKERAESEGVEGEESELGAEREVEQDEFSAKEQVPPSLPASRSHSHSHSRSQIRPRSTRKRIYTDTRFFLVYALENSVRMRLLSLPGAEGDELRASGALGWGGSRAVQMVRRERSGERWAGGVGDGGRRGVSPLRVC